MHVDGICRSHLCNINKWHHLGTVETAKARLATATPTLLLLSGPAPGGRQLIEALPVLAAPPNTEDSKRLCKVSRECMYVTCHCTPRIWENLTTHKRTLNKILNDLHVPELYFALPVMFFMQRHHDIHHVWVFSGLDNIFHSLWVENLDQLMRMRQVSEIL